MTDIVKILKGGKGMKKLVLFAALVVMFGLSFVSCSGGNKSEDIAAEKNSAENAQQEGATEGNLGAGNTQREETTADSKQAV